MNFPDNQKTGALGELAVEQLFMSWGWNVGKDRIDEGYDLFVAPNRDKYQGSRFLVQVKGTASRKGKGVIVAPVSKLRLRQYAESRMPVFIVRVMADCSLYWLHAQYWARSNLHRLSGSGTTGVRFHVSQSLADREAFESYLTEILSQIPGTSDFLVDEESLLLNSLDPRFGVRINTRNGKQQREIFAKSEDVQTTFTFRPENAPENLKNLEDAIEFGLPRSIEVENLTMTGSPLFEHISKGNQGKASLSIRNESGTPGKVRLYPGAKFSITAEQVLLEAEMFRGRKGLAISNESKDSAFDLTIRVTKNQDATQLTANVGIRSSFVSGRKIQHIDVLRPITLWAEQVLAQRSLFLELEFDGRRAALTASGGDVDKLIPFLQWVRMMSRLHLVAKALNSSFVLPAEVVLPHNEVNDIDLAYTLLKGDRCSVQVARLEFEPTQSFDGVTTDSVYCTNTLSITVLDQLLGHIPIAIELSAYVIEPVPDSTKLRLTKGVNGEAWIYYAEHENNEDWVVEVRGKR
ncbi:hypothetical protein ECAE60S_02052 [Eoetvoesiella caeni]